MLIGGLAWKAQGDLLVQSWSTRVGSTWQENHLNKKRKFLQTSCSLHSGQLTPLTNQGSPPPVNSSPGYKGSKFTQEDFLATFRCLFPP